MNDGLRDEDRFKEITYECCLYCRVLMIGEKGRIEVVIVVLVGEKGSGRRQGSRKMKIFSKVQEEVRE
jgi:hypothetical protein